ncbi:hypothetical protein AVEN_148726-1 [Araneus ventricosus]|uniref:Uncharacterized protein n=1 Tax=Araneus ventricosus TaxID=182803 RepID=A0A4Y2KMX0_ARAVE|nr:hypothetical protein AVEN_148726-1 [Araneus ventricosus]
MNPRVLSNRTAPLRRVVALHCSVLFLRYRDLCPSSSEPHIRTLTFACRPPEGNEPRCSSWLVACFLLLLLSSAVRKGWNFVCASRTKQRFFGTAGELVRDDDSDGMYR